MYTKITDFKIDLNVEIHGLIFWSSNILSMSI